MNQAIVPYKQPSLATRFSMAAKAFRMVFTGYGGSFGQPWGQDWGSAFDLLLGHFRNSKVNFAIEAGKPTQASIVMAAVNWLGRVLPEAPLQVVTADAEGKEKPIIGHPGVKLLQRPNPFYSGASLWKSFALSWITSGNPYYVKIRNGFGQVTQLWYVPPAWIMPRWPEDGSEFISYYEYQVDGKTLRLRPQDVLHFRDGADPDNMGRTGLSPVGSVLREIAADNEVPVYQYLLLKNGGVPPVMLAVRETMLGVEHDPREIKQNYLRATTGDGRGQVFVSNMALELTKLGFNPAEMDLKVVRHLPESRVASVIGIAKESLGFGAADENSTYNNVEQADERSIQSFVRPLWNYIEDELTHQLGPDFGLADNERFKFDLSEIAALQEDQNALHERANADLVSGGITVNEYREMIGQKPVPDGNVYLRSSSIVATSPEMVNKSIKDTLNPPEPKQTLPGEGPPRLLNGRTQDLIQ